MKRFIVLLLVTLALPLEAQLRHLQGALHYRGDTLDVRLALDEAGEQAWLDLPELWYAEEPAPVSDAPGGGLRVEFPFGIGALDLEPDGEGFRAARDGFTLALRPGSAPPYTREEVRFGTHAPALGGTLYLPDREDPVPAVVLVGGSSSADRSRWSYRSKADWYARRGVAALVYDRRPWDAEVAAGRTADFWSHADDLRAARDLLAAHPAIDAEAIGAHAGSQGVWITLIAQDESRFPVESLPDPKDTSENDPPPETSGEQGDPCCVPLPGPDAAGAGEPAFAWLVFTGAPAVTPAEQQLQSLAQGMKDDGLTPAAIADAVAYQRLYFAVAHRGEGWPELAAAIKALEGTIWGDYVDQPRSQDDLAWWRRHMNHDPENALRRLDVPLLVITGSRDWVVPAPRNLPLFEHYARIGGNTQVTTLTLAGADHRLETPPGEDDLGQWRFFRIHPEARAAIEGFLAERAMAR